MNFKTHQQRNSALHVSVSAKAFLQVSVLPDWRNLLSVMQRWATDVMASVFLTRPCVLQMPSLFPSSKIRVLIVHTERLAETRQIDRRGGRLTSRDGACRTVPLRFYMELMEARGHRPVSSPAPETGDVSVDYGQRGCADCSSPFGWFARRAAANSALTRW